MGRTAGISAFQLPAKEIHMPKETTHRDPEIRAARIERRAKKRADTVARKQSVKASKNRAIEAS